MVEPTRPRYEAFAVAEPSHADDGQRIRRLLSEGRSEAMKHVASSRVVIMLTCIGFIIIGLHC